ncbi:methyltransferase domain-containing protein [Christiangramia aquimixticola]|uniref:methyltransferase domain-containing protein n=1 Tax=Christiangramia aquimixticola TaxID=1697558 RepID=UPI003AA9C725
MLKISTKKRSRQSEIMDDFELKGPELEQTLRDLERINSLLGGNSITRSGIRQLNLPKELPVTIVDVGCGNGAMLRELASWGSKKGYDFKLLGIDANPYAIEIARNLSSDFANLSFLEMNIFSKEFQELEIDVLLCTLTLHHFKDEQITGLLKNFYDQAKIGVVINDLQRSKTAYVLFQAFCAVFVRNQIAVKDGLISILRGFKKEDIKKYMNSIQVPNYRINWKWAFRYLWVIQKRD